MCTASWNEYALRDHLGNTHILFSDLDGDGKLTLFDDPSTEAEEVVEAYQESHYYPFGMLMEGPFAPTLDIPDNYLYNTKEFNADFGLDWYDYGARWYDAAIGRWGGVDFLAERYYSWNVFQYAMDNPIRFLDPNGMGVTDWFKNIDTGEYTWFDREDEAFVDENGDAYINWGKSFSIIDGDGVQTNYRADGTFDNYRDREYLPTVVVVDERIRKWKFSFLGGVTWGHAAISAETLAGNAGFNLQAGGYLIAYDNRANEGSGEWLHPGKAIGHLDLVAEANFDYVGAHFDGVYDFNGEFRDINAGVSVGLPQIPYANTTILSSTSSEPLFMGVELNVALGVGIRLKIGWTLDE